MAKTEQPQWDHKLLQAWKWKTEKKKSGNDNILISTQYLTPRIADAGKVHSWRPFWESQIKHITLPQTCKKG